MRQSDSKATHKNGSAAMRQPMISSFFSQTAKGTDAASGSEPLSGSSSPIDLTISDDEGPPAKKQKIAQEPILGCATPRRCLPTPASRWRYDPSPSPEKRPVDPEAKKRRELFAKQLLVENCSFVDTPGVLDGHGVSIDHVDGEPQSSGAESDSKFKQLQELFARRTEQKTQGKAIQVRSLKKRAEVGPSGEPYTALELQVWSSPLIGSKCS